MCSHIAQKTTRCKDELRTQKQGTACPCRMQSNFCSQKSSRDVTPKSHKNKKEPQKKYIREKVMKWTFILGGRLDTRA